MRDTAVKQDAMLSGREFLSKDVNELRTDDDEACVCVRYDLSTLMDIAQ